MATAPFNPNENVPADDDIVSQFPAAERAFRDIMEDWINTEHDTSGHHKFQVISTATRDGISDWVVGSVIYNTDTETLETLTSTGPSVWSPATANVISTGTWTPALAIGGTTTGITYATQAGQYYRIGQLVTAWGHIILSNDGFGLSGALTISGLPFDSAPSPALSTIGQLVANVDEENFMGDDNWLVLPANTGTMQLWTQVTDADIETTFVFEMDDGLIGNNSGFSFTITYITDAA